MENKSSQLILHKLSIPLKVLATCLIASLLVGYLVAIFQIYGRTHFDVTETTRYYRGEKAETEEASLPPQSLATMISVSHVHTFSQPVMLALVGFLFALSYASSQAKVIFITLSFVASLVSNASPWLIRFVSPACVILLPISQMVLMLTFFIMAFVILHHLWGYKEEDFC